MSGKRKFDLNLTGELTEFPVAMIQILHWLLFCRDVRYRWIISFPLSLRLPQPHQLLITMIGAYLPGNSISNISYTYIICMFALLRRRYLDNWKYKKVRTCTMGWKSEINLASEFLLYCNCFFTRSVILFWVKNSNHSSKFFSSFNWKFGHREPCFSLNYLNQHDM